MAGTPLTPQPPQQGETWKIEEKKKIQSGVGEGRALFHVKLGRRDCWTHFWWRVYLALPAILDQLFPILLSIVFCCYAQLCLYAFCKTSLLKLFYMFESLISLISQKLRVCFLGGLVGGFKHEVNWQSLFLSKQKKIYNSYIQPVVEHFVQLYAQTNLYILSIISFQLLPGFSTWQLLSYLFFQHDYYTSGDKVLYTASRCYKTMTICK